MYISCVSDTHHFQDHHIKENKFGQNIFLYYSRSLNWSHVFISFIFIHLLFTKKYSIVGSIILLMSHFKLILKSYLTSIIWPNSFVVAHLKWIENCRYVNVAKWVSTEIKTIYSQLNAAKYCMVIIPQKFIQLTYSFYFMNFQLFKNPALRCFIMNGNFSHFHSLCSLLFYSYKMVVLFIS